MVQNTKQLTLIDINQLGLIVFPKQEFVIISNEKNRFVYPAEQGIRVY